MPKPFFSLGHCYALKLWEGQGWVMSMNPQFYGCCPSQQSYIWPVKTRFCLFLGVSVPVFFICVPLQHLYFWASNGSKHGFLGTVSRGDINEPWQKIQLHFWALYTLFLGHHKCFVVHVVNLPTIFYHRIFCFLSAWTILFFCLIVIEFWHYEVSLHLRS